MNVNFEENFKIESVYYFTLKHVVKGCAGAREIHI